LAVATIDLMTQRSTQSLQPPTEDGRHECDVLIAPLRTEILRHLESLQLPGGGTAAADAMPSKAEIRAMHAAQRTVVSQREWSALRHKCSRLLTHIANGDEVRPERIDPDLVPVESGSEAADLFRFATLQWSVPVSKGYGRRMRFLVRDRSNGKLIGIVALTDPVFNLRARDAWIGWDVKDRRARLVHTMDAHVLGALPPYSTILGGKLIVALLGAAELSDAFMARYAGRTGIISLEHKAARLTLITVTSALGRSSLYNRVRLTPSSDDGQQHTLVELVRIGATSGYGHFQVPDALFLRIRDLLRLRGHPYGDGHQFGHGPNWRLRVVRVGFELLGLNSELVRHGVKRDIYAMPLASNFRDFLCGVDEQPAMDRPSVGEIAAAAKERWLLPRAQRRPEYAAFRREEFLQHLSLPLAEEHAQVLMQHALFGGQEAKYFSDQGSGLHMPR